MPEVRYHILRADLPGTPAVIGYTFTDPAEAAATAKKLSKEMGEKLMVKPIINPKWRQREENRFYNEEYSYLPWNDDDWWQASRAIWLDHFAHPSIERPGFLAYTKSPEDGSIDKQTIVRPGAYLKKYFEQVMDRYGVSERRMVDQFIAAHGPLEVKFATTEDEIIAVYDNGPQTCMKSKGWPLDGRNPARVYAAGDLQVAYLGTLQRATARTLVWPEKKTHSRVYGDIARLTTGLNRLGYKWGAPIGAKIRKVQINKVKFDPNRGQPSHCFLAPYIDKRNEQGGGHLSIVEKDDHMVIVPEGLPGSHHCGLADGYTGYYVPREDEYPTFTCDGCETPGFRQLNTVIDNVEEGDEVAWCNACVRKYAIRCGYSGNFHNKETTEFITVEGVYWCKYYADMYAKTCEMTGELCREEHMRNVYLGDGKPKCVGNNWVAAQGGVVRSGITNRFFLRKDSAVMTSRAIGGTHIGKPEIKHHAFHCDECKNLWAIGERFQTYGDDRLLCYSCNKKHESPKLALEMQQYTATASGGLTSSTGDYRIFDSIIRRDVI